MLKENRVPDGTKPRALKLLRHLAGASGIVPESYLVGMSTRYKVKNVVIASGGSADIREGRLGGMVVAVKTIRPTRGMMPGIDVTHRVRSTAECSNPRWLIDMAIESRSSARNASFG